MIEVMPESEGNVFGVKVSGKITGNEYEDVIIPGVEAILQEHDKLRFMWLLDENFQGAAAGAVWDDTKFGFKHRHDFEKLALVGGSKWMEWLTKLAARIISGETRTFPLEQTQEAWDWLKS
jgi:hypothetical protein